ncbi:MAG: hypothetical protein P4L42_06425 [Desulfocapsaceae bacterium]|nr:hypothetical protein [Desulfocapsaceae bacterium]
MCAFLPHFPLRGSFGVALRTGSGPACDKGRDFHFYGQKDNMALDLGQALRA